MMKKDQILHLIRRACQDQRLNVWHLATYHALIELYAQSETAGDFYISRKKVMRLARISGLITYHKYIGELQTLGYIVYTPSYHPKMGSRIQLLSE
ncbi:hypothetical protein SAMN04487995_5983 [Dyadobacter koreensis]|uniref:Helix-turn-helix domain-containing protein n=1 Tax=Dyadobacter koreensis TaxID=408657 RepID=A0A1H7AV16_9BACT|nr:hypothetical protein [Dyadobacter koreensis]SEJ69429.1 hypothetical protein SAMN04487995_5983 [Dyadobacter koreensis]